MAAAEWIFVSYRRGDSKTEAAFVCERLIAKYGPNAVFFDTVSVDPGVEFPSRLRDAVQAARALIVVIGPDWLTALKERAKNKEFDYLREEIRLALERRQADDKALTIFPVLVGGNHEMPSKSELAGVCPDLADLAILQAHRLPLVPGNDDGFKPLFDEVDPIHRSLLAAQREIEERVRKEIVAILDWREMAAVKALWSADLLHADGLTGLHVQTLIAKLSRAIRDAGSIWSQPPGLTARQVQRVKEGCRQLATWLYCLAIDREAVRDWQASAKPIPVKQPGSAAVVVAVTEGLPVMASPKSRGNRFYFDRTVELDDDLDAGIGRDRDEQARHGLWSIALIEGGLPVAAQGDAELRDRLEAIALVDGRPFAIGAVIGDGTSRASREELRALAERFGVRSYARTGEPGALLRFDEGKLTAALCVCMEYIEKIQ